MRAADVRLLTMLAALTLTACPAGGENDPPGDDAGASMDAGSADTGSQEDDAGSSDDDMGSDDDAGSVQEDAGSGEEDMGSGEEDAGGQTDEGFGAITGECDVLDTELTDAQPSLVRNAIDFADDGYDESDLERLTDGGQEIIADGNAGGSSIFSEVISFEVLARCEGATLLKTETEIVYATEGKITDLLIEVDGEKIGVSVTRAYRGPNNPYSLEAAQQLLTDKLGDILQSSQNVSDEDRWTKQILHVIAYAPDYADFIEQAWDDMNDPDLAGVRADTIVIVTVTDGDDGFAY